MWSKKIVKAMHSVFMRYIFHLYMAGTIKYWKKYFTVPQTPNNDSKQ